MNRPEWPLQAEAGDSLPFALIVLAIGALLVGTLLFRTSSSLKLLETFDTTLRAQYSSDAGAEHALWQIANTTLRQTLIADLGSPHNVDVPVAVNAIIPTVQAVCVSTAAGGYVGIPECSDGIAPTIYVSNGVIVGGPDDGDDYKGTLTGTDGNDVIMGTDGDDKIYGGDGDDIIYAGDGDDKLYGGPGNDVLCGGDGKDKLYGGEGDDRLDGGLGDDKLYGEDGTDNCCNGDDPDCESQNCEAGGGAYGVFDIRSIAGDITTTVRISETVSGEIKVKAWHSEASD
ncbi:MAG TPA: calcium-binding protein [Anaerolineae bacterium]|nr:calcium-binding protein [Anaerolineae bacterium]